MSFLLVTLVCLALASSRPHIIYILADDVGYADVWGSDMPTPTLDALAARGVRLPFFYAHSTCTPSRASLMTGRYAANTGLTFAMLPGSLDGLPRNLTTMPQMLRAHGYRAHMVGKWHCGASQWAQTPVGRGFETHVGSLLWSMEYETKELWELPWSHFAVDWIRAHENGSYAHYAEPRHTTAALTAEARAVIDAHDTAADAPIFLYLAYTAAHAPLDAPHDDDAATARADAAACARLPHLWRRQYCRLMRGLDRGVGDVIERARSKLGDNLVVVFSSDNGGAPWFGGMNAPLRSGKTMPFEGGVRVPGFAVDFSRDAAYFGKGAREWRGLVHVSDWLPTFARLAGATEAQVAAERFDGVDVAPAMRANAAASPRTEILHEMYYHSRGEFMFPEDVVALRVGRWKLIEGYGLRDAHWYTEPRDDWLANDDATWATRVFELLIRAGEWASATRGRFDVVRDLLVHIGVHAWWRDAAPVTLLFDIERDPEERENVASAHADVVERLRRRAAELRDARPRQAKYWMTIDREQRWRATLRRGDCAQNPRIAPDNCLFVHPFLPDDANLDEQELIFGADAAPFVREVARKAAVSLLLPAFVGFYSLRLLMKRRRKKKK